MSASVFLIRGLLLLLKDPDACPLALVLLGEPDCDRSLPCDDFGRVCSLLPVGRAKGTALLLPDEAIEFGRGAMDGSAAGRFASPGAMVSKLTVLKCDLDQAFARSIFAAKRCTVVEPGFWDAAYVSMSHVLDSTSTSTLTLACCLPT